MTITATPTIANVISRVTGGAPSKINGPLSLVAAGGTPSFYFINPAGVVFGKNASISVPGAFYLGSADFVKFSDGKKFQADLDKGSSLSVADPKSFGFLGDNFTTNFPIEKMTRVATDVKPSPSLQDSDTLDQKSPWLRNRVTLSVEEQVLATELKKSTGILTIEGDFVNKIPILTIKPNIGVQIEPVGTYRLTYH